MPTVSAEASPSQGRLLILCTPIVLQPGRSSFFHLIILNFAARGGQLTFQREDAITPGRVAATSLDAMIAPGNMS